MPGVFFLCFLGSFSSLLALIMSIDMRLPLLSMLLPWTRREGKSRRIVSGFGPI